MSYFGRLVDAARHHCERAPDFTIELLERAIAWDPGHEDLDEAWLLYAETLETLERYEAAIRIGWRALDSQFARRSVLELFGRAFVALGRLDVFPSAPAPESPAEVHALQLRLHAEENRRALTRWLRTRPDPDTLPGNQAWLAAHPAVDARLWRAGITRTVETEIWGPVHLALESDPLEVLQLGTYVSSCSGLGGGLEYSAAAVMLDVNKRVVFARTASGRFVARQILAIDPQDRLVAYHPYPDDVAAPLFPHFEAYVNAFAQALGLTRYREGDDEDGDPDITCPASRGWWDDGPW